jgi:hypothetical protein
MELVAEVYTAKCAMPAGERFGLTAQLRRAAVSVPSFIAKGNARQSTTDHLRFLSMAAGSRAESARGNRPPTAAASGRPCRRRAARTAVTSSPNSLVFAQRALSRTPGDALATAVEFLSPAEVETRPALTERLRFRRSSSIDPTYVRSRATTTLSVLALPSRSPFLLSPSCSSLIALNRSPL